VAKRLVLSILQTELAALMHYAQEYEHGWFSVVIQISYLTRFEDNQLASAN